MHPLHLGLKAASGRWRRLQDALIHQSLARIQRQSVRSQVEIQSILQSAFRNDITLRGGMDSRNNPRRAVIRALRPSHLLVAANWVAEAVGTPLYFNFETEGSRFFFGTRVCGSERSDLHLEWPTVIYITERRELPRHAVRCPPNEAPAIELHQQNDSPQRARLVDSSYGGLGVAVPRDAAPQVGARLGVRILDGDLAGQCGYGWVRHHEPIPNDSGWVRLGLRFSEVETGAPPSTERTDFILPGSAVQRLQRRVAIAASAASAVSQRVVRRSREHRARQIRIPTVDYTDGDGRPIKAILDTVGEQRGGTAVVIPPAWGRTKETLLPLSMVLIESFRAAGEPLAVLRFDGTNRRGESFVEPDCAIQGRESLKYTFSQGIGDIFAAVDFLTANVKPSKIILVTFSLASIEGRRAVALDHGQRIDAWISVVGMADLQSGLRAVSGGIDFGYGLLAGVEFGVHTLGGVMVDMDNAGRDVLKHRLGFLEDARRDMAAIRTPVVWIHGRHDGWMDVERVREILSAGDASNRRLLEVPTGHQLRTSKEALETFQLISSEVSGLALARRIKPRLPSLTALDLRMKAERARLPRVNVDLRRFWKDYLLGSRGLVGIEFLTATDAYIQLMTEQIRALGLSDGAMVIDLGSGTGDFAVHLAERHPESGITVVAVDFVAEALHRGTNRCNQIRGHSVRPLLADLNLSQNRFLPLRTSCADAVLASLLVSYVRDARPLLEEARRLLKPGGRLVISTPRRDADISKIYMDGIRQLTPERLRQLFGPEVELNFDTLQRDFLNAGAKLLDLEEAGQFRFYDDEELQDLLEATGFECRQVSRVLGEPPLAILIAADSSPQ